MPFFSSLPADAGARHIFTLNRAAGRALVELHCAVLRDASALTAGQKELIAAYVSGLNACQYCYGVHSETARAFGVDADLLQTLIGDFERARVDPRMRALLAYARKLTTEPARMTQADVDAVFAAGCSEAQLHEAVMTTCLFNFMNRLIEGHGVKGSPELYVERGLGLYNAGYAPLLAMLADPAPAQT